MIQDINTLRQRADVFEDSAELAEALDRISEVDEPLDTGDRYYLRECSIHITAMHQLLHDVLRHMERLAERVPDPPPPA